jgi:hypothetical protein
MVVGKIDLNGIVSHWFRAFGGNARLIHGKYGRAASCACFLLALIVTIGAGAVVAKVGKRVAAHVSIGPLHFHSFPRGNMNLQVRWFFALIELERHISFYQSGVRSSGFLGKRQTITAEG